MQSVPALRNKLSVRTRPWTGHGHDLTNSQYSTPGGLAAIENDRRAGRRLRTAGITQPRMNADGLKINNDPRES